MACCCRTAALRTFTRGYTQLHIADSASGAISPSIWRQSRTVTVPRVRYRSLHYTSAWRNEAATAEPRAMSESLKQHARNPLPEQHQQNSGTIDNAAPSGSESVAELTPEAIDALASEITPSRNLPDIDPHQSEAVANPSKKSRHASLEPREPAARLPRKVRRLLQFGPGDTPPQTDMTEEERKKSRRDSTNLKDKRKDTYAAARKNTRGPADELKPEKEPWMVQKDALEKKFGDEGWRPQKRLSPDALQGIRALHQQFPDVYTTPVLAERFEMSPEAIRRILKSKWTPSNEEEEQRQQRWFKRGKQIWEQKAQQGAKPPKKWRDEGIKTNWNAKRQFVKRRSEQRRRDLEENDSPPSQFNDRARPYRFRIGNNTVGHESQPLRRHGGPRRLGHAGGSGRRQD